MVARLSERGPQSIVRLSADATVSRQAVAKHLRVLEEAGVVRGSREGRERIWAIEPARLEAARRSLDLLETRWDRAVDRLRVFVER